MLLQKKQQKSQVNIEEEKSSKIQKDSEQFLNRYDELTRSSPEKDQDQFNDLLMESFHSPFSRSKTQNHQFLSNIIKNNSMKKQVSSIDYADQSDKSHINQSIEPQKVVHSKQDLTKCSPIKIRERSQTYTSILVFGYKKYIQINEVYNLFSNFGNIAAIVKKKQHIFVKFRLPEYTSIAYSYLNNYRFLGNHLSLQSPLSQSEAMPKQQQWSQCIFYDSSFDRFTQRKSISINSPSNTLHVSSLKKEICSEQVLFEIFSKYGDIEYVQILRQNQDKRMALVKFYSIEDSFRAIAALHNQSFYGRKMQISFTKSRN